MSESRILELLETVKRIEGDFVDHPDDPGGATRWGVTEREARRAGYTGDMRDYPWDGKHYAAVNVYKRRYVTDPNFHAVGELSWAVADELIDTGINMGTGIPGPWLQRSLNALNNKGSFYSDLVVDGQIGDRTLAAMEAYLDRRGPKGEAVLLKVLNGLQVARYVDITERNERLESFFYGWISHRIEL